MEERQGQEGRDGHGLRSQSVLIRGTCFRDNDTHRFNDEAFGGGCLCNK
jgi:hypothetical protein